MLRTWTQVLNFQRLSKTQPPKGLYANPFFSPFILCLYVCSPNLLHSPAVLLSGSSHIARVYLVFYFCSLSLIFFLLRGFMLPNILPPLFNKQRHSVTPLFHTGSRDVRTSYILFQFHNPETSTVTARVACCVIVGSIFNTAHRLERLFERII